MPRQSFIINSSSTLYVFANNYAAVLFLVALRISVVHSCRAYRLFANASTHRWWRTLCAPWRTSLFTLTATTWELVITHSFSEVKSSAENYCDTCYSARQRMSPSVYVICVIYILQISTPPTQFSRTIYQLTRERIPLIERTQQAPVHECRAYTASIATARPQLDHRPLAGFRWTRSLGTTTLPSEGTAASFPSSTSRLPLPSPGHR